MDNYKILNELNISAIYDLSDLRKVVKRFLEENRKEVFESDELLVIMMGDYDLYNDQPAGLKLSIIQNLVDHNDISRCFVKVLTTNPDIETEIKVLSNSDNKFQRLSFGLMEGGYSKLDANDRVYRYSDPMPTRIELSKLTDREFYLLTKSKTFCMYPWIHINASPNGEAQPCCLWDYKVPMGSVKENTLKELWNSDNWKQLRKNMLEDIPNPGCSRCYEEEKAGFFSNRQSSNKHHGNHIDRISKTNEDGHLDSFELTYWDIRFSNLCNLSCRSCGHIFSSSWYQDQAKISGPDWKRKNKALFWAGRYETDMLEQLMEHIDYVEQIYFAGGEPLIMEEHYHILEELERRKKFNVRLVYNTNFTKTKLKDRYVFDYWRKFDSVSIGASLDAMGQRAEYIRKGTNWEEVENNRRLMLEICPKVDFYISPTLSIQNALHLPDFHRDWVEKGFLKPEDLNVNLLQDPEWLRSDMATPEYKEKIVEKYEKHLEWLRPIDTLQRATQGFESAIRFIKAEDRSDLLPEFWKRMRELDKIRNEDVLTAIPELNELT